MWRERDENRGPLEQERVHVQQQSHWSGGAVEMERGGEVAGKRTGRRAQRGGEGVVVVVVVVVVVAVVVWLHVDHQIQAHRGEIQDVVRRKEGDRGSWPRRARPQAEPQVRG